MLVPSFPFFLSSIPQIPDAMSNISYIGGIPWTCVLLKARLPGRVYSRGSEAYEESIASYAYPASRLRPVCIVKPTSAQDVSAAITILGQPNTPHVVEERGEYTPFAIRGGGHNINPGWGGIHRGVTIDMRAIKNVEIDKEHSVVRVGAGALWQSVYDVVEPQGLTVLGGRIGDVGVAGLTLGGE
jgi:FAD/FMN-containing dehydrogenase